MADLSLGKVSVPLGRPLLMVVPQQINALHVDFMNKTPYHHVVQREKLYILILAPHDPLTLGHTKRQVLQCTKWGRGVFFCLEIILGIAQPYYAGLTVHVWAPRCSAAGVG